MCPDGDCVRDITHKQCPINHPRGNRVGRARVYCGNSVALSEFFQSASAGYAAPPDDIHATRAPEGVALRSSLTPRPFISPFFQGFSPSRHRSPLASLSLSCGRELLLSNDTTRRTDDRESRTFLLDLRIIMSLSSLGIIYRDRGARPCRVNLSTGVLAFRTVRCAAKYQRNTC